jgi:transposase, IS5 family
MLTTLRIKQLYQRLLGITRATVREAETVAHQVIRARSTGVRPAARAAARDPRACPPCHLANARPGLQGDTHHPDKVLSLLEPHTEVIRKGKAAKPTEFGKFVKIQEAEVQFITDYTVSENVALQRCATLSSHVPMEVRA